MENAFQINSGFYFPLGEKWYFCTSQGSGKVKRFILAQGPNMWALRHKGNCVDLWGNHIAR